MRGLLDPVLPSANEDALKKCTMKIIKIAFSQYRAEDVCKHISASQQERAKAIY